MAKAYMTQIEDIIDMMITDALDEECDCDDSSDASVLEWRLERLEAEIEKWKLLVSKLIDVPMGFVTTPEETCPLAGIYNL